MLAPLTCIWCLSVNLVLFGGNWSLRFSVRQLRLALFYYKSIGGLTMIFLLILPLAIYLIINCIFAKKFEEIAFQKGYDNSIHSFALCFWFGILGYLYVIALPNLKNDCNSNGANIKKECDNDIESNLCKEKPNKDKYDKLIAKAERFKDTFFDRNYRISTYESIVQEMEFFASENFEDSAIKLEEYKSHLELLKNKKIK